MTADAATRPVPGASHGTTAARRARRLGRLALPASLAVVVGLVTTACSTPVPQATPEPSVTQPALSLDQDTAILGKVGDVLAVADKKRDSKALSQRLAGPALAMRTAELSVAKKTKSDDDVTALPTKVQTVVVPTSTTWPRAAFAVSAQPSGSEPPRLLALRQSSARADYALWGWARLFPGITMPSFAAPGTGSAAVPSDDTTLVVTPKAAVANYVDVLNKGSKSKHAKSYANDPFRTRLASKAAALDGNKDFKDAKGAYAETFTVAKTAPASVRTADGGALVMADASAVEKTSAESKAKIAPSTDATKALFGDTKPTNTLVVTYRDVFALYVPPAGASDAKVKVLGVEHVPVKVGTHS
ncbi:hypothetical protein [Luteimicrobium sp. DT211]|uniref:hypothetical protein n=1 Tax=Luteimicrobium sp. DT211 TaxID=3393412 RepID=UPI003CF08078